MRNNAQKARDTLPDIHRESPRASLEATQGNYETTAGKFPPGAACRRRTAGSAPASRPWDKSGTQPQRHTCNRHAHSWFGDPQAPSLEVERATAIKNDGWLRILGWYAWTLSRNLETSLINPARNDPESDLRARIFSTVPLNRKRSRPRRIIFFGT